MEENKRKIISLFFENVKGKQIIINGNKHHGSIGHWLEKMMNIQHNNYNQPDIYGYEMKKYSPKITFGDFSASEYLFSKKKYEIDAYNKWDCIKITREQFIKFFGTQKPLKNNRYSWSGGCVPIYGEYNSSGQILQFNENNDLCVFYLYSKDERTTKHELPEYLKTQFPILIVIWKCEKLKKHIENKFNKKGFFICKKTGDTFDKICFGKPFDYNTFVENIKSKNIIFDSGMFSGNTRNYSCFRSSSKSFWENLIIEEHG